jgi:adenylate cyclase, class 2
MPVPDVIPPRRNVELKARLQSLAAAREIAVAVATSGPERQHQTDTYFTSARGRLKLREIAGGPAQLISYARPDGSHPRASDYRLAPVADAAALKAALTDALGVQVVVEKRREVYLHHNVRIHLDEVRGLGAFLEFEAVLGGEHDEPAGRALVEHLAALFGIAASDVVACSYSDLLKASQ